MSTAEEDREISEFWDRYAALSTREQVRQEGFSRWTCNTTSGVVFMLAAALLFMWLFSQLVG